ncbi:MAG: 2-oxoacid:acceptor oxidoreductase family protein, partial [Phycisphaerae bacterium]|nr:2-oxoacid:acceptor oxidoreductase family protein [Phycisphaerae bacterium]
QITELFSKNRQKDGWDSCAVWGKVFPDGQEGLPSVRGLHPSIVADRLARLGLRLLPEEFSYDQDRFTKQLQTFAETARPVTRIPIRTPTFCPGCPHRDSASILLEIIEDFKDAKYMQRRHGRDPVGLICHGDTGCYTLLMFPPNEQLMHNYSGMGLGGGTGAGVDPFVTNKQLVFMGDSTFFHSGQAAISNSLFGKQDITYIILDNHTTGMTGHQTHAGMGKDLLNNPTPAQDIESIIRALLEPDGCLVVRADPHDRKGYRQILEDALLREGVKVIIADRECSIVSNRRVNRQRQTEIAKRGYLRKRSYTNITEEVCEYCLRCTSLTSCPGFSISQTDYGPKMQTDLSWCVGEGTCEQIGACPAVEELTVIRKKPFQMRSAELHLEKFPAPEVCEENEVWRAHIAGVGGMGIGVATSILVRAGFKQGYGVLFADKKGMAIRNGGVYSQIVFAPADKASQIIPYGKADLLLGIDMLEAGRAIDPKLPFRVCSPERTATVLNTELAPTTNMLLGEEEFQADELLKDIAARSKGENFLAINVTKLCERLLATKLHMNMALLGAAFQKG